MEGARCEKTKNLTSCFLYLLRDHRPKFKLYRNFHFIYAGFGVARTKAETTHRLVSTTLSVFNLKPHTL